MDSFLKDGTFIIDGLIAGPSLTERALLERHAKDARPIVFNGPHHSYLLPRTVLGDREFLPSLWFTGDLLKRIELSYVDPQTRSWHDWSWERGTVVQAQNADWAEAFFGTAIPAEHPWGKIESILDARGGGAHILIRYNPPF